MAGNVHCQLNARENRNVFSVDLNVPSESLSVTVAYLAEFQVPVSVVGIGVVTVPVNGVLGELNPY